DGPDQEGICVRYAGRRGILPDQDGSIDHMSSHSHQPSFTSQRRHVRFVAAAAAIALAPLTLRAQETGLPVGSKAPTSTIVETLEGKSFDIGQYVGKTPVLIEFWATWCP